MKANKPKPESRDSRDKRLNAAISKAIAGFKPPERMTVSEWADRNRRLSAESSAEVGQWRTSRTPYMKEPLDSFTDPKVKHIVIVASSQVGKSEAINNMIGYIINQDPGSILFIQPTITDAKEYSKLRIAPMIRDTPSLKQKVADSKSRDSANTVLQKSYPGGILTMTGSQEAHALASKPIRYLFGDERDRWVTSAGDEGDPWDLATARQITFYNAKAVEVSTPTIKGKSTIVRAYGEGTMEHWCTQCPHCGGFHEIVFENVRYEYETTVTNNEKTYHITSIWYVCPECGCVSSEQNMRTQPAKWIADNPSALLHHGTRSFWISSFVSPWASWESTLLMYLKAQGDSKKMQVVYNTRFGLPWEDRGDLENEDKILSRREEYKAELPDGVLLLTCGVDTQDDRLEYEVVGHRQLGERWGIRKGIIMGRPDSDDTWSQLDDIIGHVYRFENGIGLHISLTFVDEGGHFTQEVRRRCRERQRNKVFAIKGRGGSDIPYTAPPKEQKITIRGAETGKCWVYTIGVDAGKQLIMDDIRVKTAGPRYCHFPARDDYGEAFFKGYLSERLVYNDKAKKNPWQWEKIPGHERNEALDCRNYANAAAVLLKADYEAIEARLKQLAENGNKKQAEKAAPKSSMPLKPRRKKQMYDDW